MAIRDLMPALRELDCADKLRVLQFLIQELAREEGALLAPDTEYPVWTPYDAFDAAATLLGTPAGRSPRWNGEPAE
jgi:hypothetical protein